MKLKGNGKEELILDEEEKEQRIARGIEEYQHHKKTVDLETRKFVSSSGKFN